MDLMKFTIRLSALALALFMLAGCNTAAPETSDSGGSSPNISSSPAPSAHEGEVSITLSDEGVLVDGTAAPADGSAAVYTARDIIYYEDRDTYDSGNPYGEGTDSDKHTAQEAEEHTVVHITQPGTYRVSGTLSRGQITVDLILRNRADVAAFGYSHSGRGKHYLYRSPGGDLLQCLRVRCRLGGLR